MNNTLLLTATIRPPPGAPNLHRIDPRQRMNDYIHALDFYCRLPKEIIPRIVFVENSASNLSPLQEVVLKANALGRVEFLSFDGQDHPPQYGRGYGEFKLLDYAMEHSYTLGSANVDDVLWKVTGRYRVLNLVTLVHTAPSDFQLYCDIRDWPIPWVDLRIFGCTVSGYQYLLRGIYSQLKANVINMAPEQYLRPSIGELAKSHRVVTRFRREPRVDGIRGVDSKNYSSRSNLLKYLFRSSIRHAARLLGDTPYLRI